jgi:hypothetical protein
VSLRGAFAVRDAAAERARKPRTPTLFAAGTLLFAGAAALSAWGVVGCTSVSSAGFNEETDGERYLHARGDARQMIARATP